MAELTVDQLSILQSTIKSPHHLKTALERYHHDATIPTIKTYIRTDGQKSPQPIIVRSFLSSKVAEENLKRGKEEYPFLIYDITFETPDSLKNDEYLTNVECGPSHINIRDIYEDLYKQLKLMKFEEER